MQTERLATCLPLALGLVLAAAGAAAAPPDERGIPYDTERGIYLVDTDGDTFPDLTEEIEKTDHYGERDFPGRQQARRGQKASGFPNIVCRAGFQPAGSRLCISEEIQGNDRFADATFLCREQRAYVCGYEEIRFLYLRTNLDATFNVSGRWLGDWTGDDQVLCGNRSITSDNDPDIANFEGTCDRDDFRAYWCCHDDAF
jgi:hypothetical protein